MRTARCRWWGGGERWLCLLWGAILHLILKWHAHLNIGWFDISFVFCDDRFLIYLGDDDVLRDVSLLHKLSLSTGASTPCFLILLQLSYITIIMFSCENGWYFRSHRHHHHHQNYHHHHHHHDHDHTLNDDHQNLWFTDILTAIIDGGQDDRNHWRLTRLRWAADYHYC